MEAKAFLFDLDGVLTNTSQCHFLAWKQLCSRLKLKFDEKDNHRLLGVSRLRSLEIILELNGCASKFTEKQKEQLADEKNRIYLSMIENITPDDLLPGIPKFLSQAKSRNIRLAVASASRNAGFVLENLKIRDAFDYIADASKIANPKPHPEIFLNCSHALGIEPLYCIGFEDSQAGIEAIHAAGMFSVGIGVLVTTVAPDLALDSTGQLSLSLLSDSYSLWLKKRNKKI
ncbi:MAG TPA: beta-phosphoglucomutase [Candidatus Avimonas sp.]|jgi:beta-phosphoglucomutase|nr:beta-phosphoglucomutase [Candidatus Avimonas sp.]HQD38566.1 beta-phosphoglucomutase [Candidatus Avimonas sp.]